MMVNTRHLMCRADIFSDLGNETPATWDEVFAAAETVKQAGVVDCAIGATIKSGWNLAQEFVNMYPGYGGKVFNADNTTAVNADAGMKAIETMAKTLDYTDPRVRVSDSTYVRQQFQQGKIAMSNLWSSRGGAMDDPAESSGVGKVRMAAAPKAMADGAPAMTLWRDGIVIAANITDEEADAAFRLAMEGLDKEVVKADNEAAIWLVKGYEPGPLAQSAIATTTASPAAPACPSTTQMGLLHTAHANVLPAFLTGDARGHRRGLHVTGGHHDRAVPVPAGI